MVRKLPAPKRKNGKLFSYWEYVVNDFFDLHGPVSDRERFPLFQELRKEGPFQDAIDTHPTFSIEGKLVTAIQHTELKEFWIFKVCDGKIIKHRIKR